LKAPPGQPTTQRTDVRQPTGSPGIGRPSTPPSIMRGEQNCSLHCRYCRAETHEACDCQYAPRDEQPPAKQPKSSSWGAGPGQRQERSNSCVVELCELFNAPDGNRCTFRWCRFTHVCGKCRRGPHPAAECGARGQGPKARSGSYSGSRQPKDEPHRRT
jgi:hypothetical protein